MGELVRSVSYDQSEIIRSILKLHAPEGRIDCDPTFSTGAFYNGTGIEAPALRFDINPQISGVVEADARQLPVPDESLSCMMLDPPFLATKGKSLKAGDGNRINRRFGVYPDERSLHQCYEEMLREAYRVLKPGGILVFKCQDKVSSGKQYFSHVFVMNAAVKTGFYPKDLFILLAKNRLVADWQTKNQQHARKYHCYFWVFQKNKIKINYGGSRDEIHYQAVQEPDFPGAGGIPPPASGRKRTHHPHGLYRRAHDLRPDPAGAGAEREAHLHGALCGEHPQGQ